MSISQINYEGSDMRNNHIETRVALLEQSIVHINDTLIRLEKRFDKIDERFDKIDIKFNRIDAKFEIMDQKIDKLNSLLWTNFYWILGIMLSLACVAGGILAKGFGWFH